MSATTLSRELGQMSQLSPGNKLTALLHSAATETNEENFVGRPASVHHNQLYEVVSGLARQGVTGVHSFIKTDHENEFADTLAANINTTIVYYGFVLGYDFHLVQTLVEPLQKTAGKNSPLRIRIKIEGNLTNEEKFELISHVRFSPFYDLASNDYPYEWIFQPLQTGDIDC